MCSWRLGFNNPMVWTRIGSSLLSVSPRSLPDLGSFPPKVTHALFLLPGGDHDSPPIPGRITFLQTRYRYLGPNKRAGAGGRTHLWPGRQGNEGVPADQGLEVHWLYDWRGHQKHRGLFGIKRQTQRTEHQVERRRSRYQVYQGLGTHTKWIRQREIPDRLGDKGTQVGRKKSGHKWTGVQGTAGG